MKQTAAVLFALLVASCGTTELSGEDRSEFGAGRKAIVKTWNQPLLAGMVFGDSPVVQILSVDGRKLDSAVLKLDEQIAVDIGVREVEFACVDRAGYNEEDFTEVIELNVKPHHEYLVGCSFESRFGPDGNYAGSFDVKEKRVE